MLKSKSNGISKLQRPFLIGVTGGTSSGKKSVCEKIVQQLEEVSVLNGSRKVAIIRQDSFYNTLNKEEMVLAEKCQYNFDHPDAFDTELMINTISDISRGKKVYVPKYDVKANSRMLKGEFTEVSECDVVLFVGILTFYHKEIRDLLHMKIFVDCDADTRLSRAVLRDTSERGKHLETVLQKYTNFVKPAFEGYCLPTKKFADIIIPRGVENTVAINLIVQHLRDVLCGGGGHTPLVKKNGDSEEDR